MSGTRASRPLGLGLRGIAMVSYTELGVVDAENVLSDDFDGLAGDFLLIRIFTGAQFARHQDRIVLLRELANLVNLPHAPRGTGRGFMRLVGLSVHYLAGATMRAIVLRRFFVDPATCA
jgi:hypothetical protein